MTWFSVNDSEHPNRSTWLSRAPVILFGLLSLGCIGSPHYTVTVDNASGETATLTSPVIEDTIVRLSPGSKTSISRYKPFSVSLSRMFGNPVTLAVSEPGEAKWVLRDGNQLQGATPVQRPQPAQVERSIPQGVWYSTPDDR